MNRSDAVALDARDPLAGFRARFVVDPQLVYLDGNSLGMLPLAALERLSAVAAGEWGGRLVRAWEEGWMELPGAVGDRIGSVALGAAPGQVVVADSTTVCFYKLASAALDARPGRRTIVTDAENFPTDRYVLEGLAQARGMTVAWGDPSAIDEDTALVSFSHVDYRSGRVLPMREVNRLAHEAGALTVWDLSHSVGAVPVALDADGADLAVGCTYKYLCAGPGAPAFMYVARELQGRLSQPIWGWLGRRDPFAMEAGYVAAQGMRGFLSGTPPVLALACVSEGVALVGEAGIERLRAKGIALTELVIALADARLASRGVQVASPRDSDVRGAHLALAHPRARELCQALVARGVIVDFRRPDVIRFGCSPLTTRFVDVWDAIDVLAGLVGYI